MNVLVENSMKVDSYLPVFQGFYGTIWEPEESNEIEYYNEQREQDGLSELPYEAFKFDYEEYENQVGEKACRYIERLLSNYVSEVNFQCIYSPKEYNFANDSVYCEFVLNGDNIEAIKAFIFQHVSEFTEYIKSRYTSRDGFLSYHSNNSTTWLLELDQALQHKHKLGSILEFIIETDESLDIYSEGVLYDMYEATSDACLSIENYEDVTEMEYCPECNEFVKPENFAGVCLDCLEIGQHTGEYVVCSCCKSKIENPWEKRQLSYAIKHGFLSPAQVKCNDCANS